MVAKNEEVSTPEYRDKLAFFKMRDMLAFHLYSQGVGVHVGEGVLVRGALWESVSLEEREQVFSAQYEIVDFILDMLQVSVDFGLKVDDNGEKINPLRAHANTEEEALKTMRETGLELVFRVRSEWFDMFNRKQNDY